MPISRHLQNLEVCVGGERRPRAGAYAVTGVRCVHDDEGTQALRYDKHAVSRLQPAWVG